MTNKRPPMDGPTGERVFGVALREARVAGFRGDEARDLAREAATKAIKAWPDFVEDGDGSLERWVSTIARNLIRDQRRHDSRARQKAPVAVHAQQQAALEARPLSPETTATNSSVRAARLRLYETLPHGLRAALPLVAKVNAKEISRAEAAKRLGLSVHTYDKVAVKVKEALREAIVAQGIDIDELHEVNETQERLLT